MKRKQDSNIKMPAVKKVLISCFLCAAVLVSGFTAYSLMMPAKTATDEQEVEISTVHTHTDDCYRMGRKLVCKSTDEDHIHSEECYEERKILVCEEGEKENKAESNTEAATAATAAAEDSAESESVAEATAAEAPTEAQDIQEATTLSEKASEGETSKEQATQGEETTPKKDSKAAAEESKAPEDPSSYTDFKEYLESTGGEIDDILADSNENCITFIYGAEGDGYSYTLSFKAKNGIMSGNYKYELPAGLKVTEDSRTGNINFGGVVVGAFEVDVSTGLLVLRFGSEAVHYQDVWGTLSLSASMTARSGVEKEGYLINPADNSYDGYFHFNISAKIPASVPGMLKCEWKLSDESYSPNIVKTWAYGFGSKIYEERPNVYISYGNIKREIRNIEEVYNDAGESIAYYIDTDKQEFYLVNRCECDNGEECVVGSDSSGCESILPAKYSGWCTCWNLEEDSVVSISYKSRINGYDFERDQAQHPEKSIEELMRDNGVLKSQDKITSNDVYNNTVTLKGRNKNGSNNQESSANISMFRLIDKNEKVYADAKNNYVGKFEVVLNPDKLDITPLANPNSEGVNVFTVDDAMINLRYINGSLRITAETQSGDRFNLVYGEDFTVSSTYDSQKHKGNLEIQISKIGAYKYSLSYSARIDSDTDKGVVEINNIVSTSGGDTSEGNGVIEYGYERRIFYNSFFAKMYTVTVRKTDKNTGENLSGAKYGLYSEDGNLIATHETNDKGMLKFNTDVVEGVIYELDTPYYIKEVTAPDGYGVDTKKYWFYFGASQNAETEQSFAANHQGEGELKYVAPEANDAYKFILELELTDEKIYILPETGGIGSEIFVVSGILMLCAAFGLMIIVKKAKR